MHGINQVGLVEVLEEIGLQPVGGLVDADPSHEGQRLDRVAHLG
ncbi:MAG: hypothetical protein ACYS0D_07955 [Planctomycetota bacterium]|jgi:hypothetical protein